MELPKVTDAQRHALVMQPGEFARVEDDLTQKFYLLIEEGRARELYQQWLREQLQVGFDEADRGQMAEWNLDEFLAKMRRKQVKAE